MLSPKKTKFRKFHRRLPSVRHRKSKKLTWHKPAKLGSRRTNHEIRGPLQVEKHRLVFGDCGIRATQFGRFNMRCVEAARRAMRRYVQRTGRIYIRVFPQIGMSAKPLEMRMGKGKGPHKEWILFIKPGQVLFEFVGVPLQTAEAASVLGRAKLPIESQFIIKR